MSLCRISGRFSDFSSTVVLLSVGALSPLEGHRVLWVRREAP